MNEGKHVCPLCDYVYKDSEGDPAHGIAAAEFVNDSETLFSWNLV